MAAAYPWKRGPVRTRTRSFEYLTEPESALKCQICREVAVRPLQEVSCGKLFCTKCLDCYGRRRRCLSCGDTRPFYFADTRGRISIQGLPVKCNDCNRKVLYGHLQAHWAKCDLLPCPKNCNDETTLSTKKDLTKHLDGDCPNGNLKYGEEGSAHNIIMEVHEPNCVKVDSDCTDNFVPCVVPCPTECNEMALITKEYLAKFLETDRDLKYGEDSSSRITEVHEPNSDCTEVIMLQGATNNLHESEHSGPPKSNETALFTKEDLEGDCPDRDLKCVEESSARIVEVHEPNCVKTEVIFQGTTNYLRESEQSVIPCPKKCNETALFTKEDLTKHLENDCPNINRQLHFQAALDSVNSINSTVLNRQESMTFKVTEFTTKMNTNAIFYSPTFYSSQNGYHFQVAVYANGLYDGLGKFVSIYLYLIKGRCDEKLNWPMVANVRFEILNQIQDNGHHMKNMYIRAKDNMVVDKSMGYSRFLHHSLLRFKSVSSLKKNRKGRKCHEQRQRKYLKDKDNSLVFRVSIVDKDWLNCTV